MPLESATTLQQDDSIRAVSVGSGDSSAGGGGAGLVPFEIEVFVPGSLQPSTYYIRHVARYEIALQDVRIDANTAPSSDTDFIIDKKAPSGNTTSVKTVTLGGSNNQKTADLSETISVDDKLRVQTDTQSSNFSGDIERVTINVKAELA